MKLLATLILALLTLPSWAQPKAETRILLLGGAWVEGAWLQPDQTLSARLEYYLNKYLKRKIKVINGAASVHSPSEIVTRLDSLFNAHKPDHVIYIMENSRDLVLLASDEFWIERNPDLSIKSANFIRRDSWLVNSFRRLFDFDGAETTAFSRYINLQIGSVRFSRQLNKSSEQASKLIEPLGNLVNQIKAKSAKNGARFNFLWAGSHVEHWAWNLPFVPEGGLWFLTVFDRFKTRVLISNDNLIYSMRKNRLPVIVDMRASQELRHLWWNNDAWKTVDATDHIARLFATSIFVRGL